MELLYLRPLVLSAGWPAGAPRRRGRRSREQIDGGQPLGPPASSRLSGWMVVGVLVLILAACAPGQTEIAPPEIVYGETVCADCTMIISDVRFASGYAYEVAPGRYESKAFDDIGDMLTHAAAHTDDAIVAWYVHDFQDESWLDATQAVYVQSRQVPSPMGHGLAAFAGAGAADRFASEVDGQVLSWDELRAAMSGGGNATHTHDEGG